MTRILYDIEDLLDDTAQSQGLPRIVQRILSALSRTAGEAGDMIARHQAY